MKKLLLSALLVTFGLISFSQTPPDDDNDSVPNSEDECPFIKGTKENKGCPINGSIKTVISNNELSDQDKKNFLANFQKVLQQIPGRFQKFKTGEDELDFTNRISWFKSNLQLFPNHSDKSKTQLMYGTYNGKPVIAFIENAPVDVNAIVNILMPVLKAKGMVEVNTKFVMDDPAARSFRSKDAVLQINSVATGGSSLSIGKIPYYYENDVKPITAAKSKPVSKSVSVTPPSNTSTVFIEPSVFEDIFETICKNRVYLKITGNIQPADNVIYKTGFPMNGYKGNLPVFYKQVNKYNFSTIIGLSENMTDLDKAAKYINSLFAKTGACSEAYRTFILEFDAATGKYTDVSAWDDGGMFIYVEKENGLVQLRVNKIIYTDEEKKKANKPGPAIVTNPCNDMEIILKECVQGFKNVKGTFVKKETPAEYYTTTLPGFGLKDKFVVESKNIEFENGNMIRKSRVYYDAEEDFSSSSDALNKYEGIKNLIKKCFSGTVNVSDENNQKIYEFFTTYQGYSIRIALIYLNLFGSSSVSITIRVKD